MWDAIASGELAQDAKDLADYELVLSLTELAQKQKCEIGYLTQFRRELERIRAYDPEKLKHLSSASLFAELQPLIEKLSAEENPKKAWERKRGRYRRWTDAVLVESNTNLAATEKLTCESHRCLISLVCLITLRVLMTSFGRCW